MKKTGYKKSRETVPLNVVYLPWIAPNALIHLDTDHLQDVRTVTLCIVNFLIGTLL